MKKPIAMYIYGISQKKVNVLQLYYNCITVVLQLYYNCNMLTFA